MSTVHEHAGRIRVKLNLYASCDENYSTLDGLALRTALAATNGSASASGSASTGAPSPGCVAPATGLDAAFKAACPSLGEAQRAQLEKLCGSNFDDAAAKDQIAAIFGEPSACLYLCEFGSVTRGSTWNDAVAAKFNLDYGDEVAGIFHTNVIDARALRLGSCVGAYGSLTGMFRFTLRRSPTAQPFP